MGDDSEFHLLNGTWPHLKTVPEDSAANQQAWCNMDESIHAQGTIKKIQFWTGLLIIEKAMYFWTLVIMSKSYFSGCIFGSLHFAQGYNR